MARISGTLTAPLLGSTSSIPWGAPLPAGRLGGSSPDAVRVGVSRASGSVGLCPPAGASPALRLRSSPGFPALPLSSVSVSAWICALVLVSENPHFSFLHVLFAVLSICLSLVPRPSVPGCLSRCESVSVCLSLDVPHQLRGLPESLPLAASLRPCSPATPSPCPRGLALNPGHLPFSARVCLCASPPVLAVPLPIALCPSLSDPTAWLCQSLSGCLSEPIICPPAPIFFPFSLSLRLSPWLCDPLFISGVLPPSLHV